MSRNAKRSRVELRRSFLDRRSDRQEWEPHVGTRKSTRTAEQRPWRMERREERKRRAGPSRTQPPDGTEAHPGKREVIRAFVPPIWKNVVFQKEEVSKAKKGAVNPPGADSQVRAAVTDSNHPKLNGR